MLRCFRYVSTWWMKDWRNRFFKESVSCKLLRADECNKTEQNRWCPKVRSGNESLNRWVCMKALIRVDEAKLVLQDCNKWKLVVCAYPEERGVGKTTGIETCPKVDCVTVALTVPLRSFRFRALSGMYIMSKTTIVMPSIQSTTVMKAWKDQEGFDRL